VRRGNASPAEARFVGKLSRRRDAIANIAGRVHWQVLYAGPQVVLSASDGQTTIMPAGTLASELAIAADASAVVGVYATRGARRRGDSLRAMIADDLATRLDEIDPAPQVEAASAAQRGGRAAPQPRRGRRRRQPVKGSSLGAAIAGSTAAIPVQTATREVTERGAH
jgi:hypothetical protein